MRLIAIILYLLISSFLAKGQFSSAPTEWPTTEGYHVTTMATGTHTWNTFDMNGDDLPDLVETYDNDFFGTPGNYYWKVYLNSGSGFSSSPTNWSTPDGFATMSMFTFQHTWNTFDINGDDLPDLVETYDNAFFGTPGNYYWKVYLNTGSGFSASPINWTTTNGFQVTSIATGTHTWQTMDMNGDNLPDLVETYDNALFGTAGNYYWKVYLNTGTGFNASPINWATTNGFATAFMFTFQHTWHTFDINGDGLPDLVETYDNAFFGTPGNYYWKVFLNNGSGFNSTATNWLTHNGFQVTSISTGTHTWQTMDMNGDDLPDIVETYDNDYFGTPGSYYWKVYLNSGSGFSAVPFQWSTPGGFATAFMFTFQHTWHTLDINGDDLPDLVETYDNAYFGTPGDYHWNVYLNSSGLVGLQDENEKPSVLNVFPNPISNTLHVNLSGFVNPSIQLYNNLGKLVINENEVSQTDFKIDANTLPAGIYQLSVSDRENSESTKLLKL